MSTREIAIAKLIKEFSRIKQMPLFDWRDGRIPNDADEKASIKIRDNGPVVSLQDDKLIGQVRTWAWLAKNKKPSEADIKNALANNLCRCGTHARIVRAVKRASAQA